MAPAPSQKPQEWYHLVQGTLIDNLRVTKKKVGLRYAFPPVFLLAAKQNCRLVYQLVRPYNLNYDVYPHILWVYESSRNSSKLIGSNN